MNTFFPLRILFFLASVFIFCQKSNAQVYDQRGQGIYLELLGSTGFVSLNYEIRFTESTGGLGGRIGFTGLDNSLIFPVMINYMFGKVDKNRFWEIGAGALYSTKGYPFVVKLNTEQKFETNPLAIFSLTYRYHPRYGGLLFRFGFTPIMGMLEATPDHPSKFRMYPMFGIALGKAF